MHISQKQRGLGKNGLSVALGKLTSSEVTTQIIAKNWESVLEDSLWTCCCLVFLP